MNAFPGDLVNVAITAVRVIGTNALTGAPTIVDEHGNEFPMPPQAAVEHVAPAEWPPEIGDLWRDKHGSVWFACGWVDEEISLRASDGRGEKSVRAVQGQLGPLTLVHREGVEGNA